MAEGRKIVVAGGTGLIGSALVGALVARGDEVVRLVRRASPPVRGSRDALWEGKGAGPWASELDGAHAVVNLSGRSIACRWNARHRREILESRVESTRAIGQAVARAGRPPTVWVNASAIGFYGDRGDEEVDEASRPGSGFLADVCVAWERELFASPQAATKRVAVRTGFVLCREGGALPPLIRLARLGLGGRLGSGRQWWSPIHLADLVRIYLAAVEGAKSGPVVAAMPKPERNAEFMMLLRHLVGRNWGAPSPAFLLRAIGDTIGPDAALTLDSVRAVPRAAVEAGVEFRYPSVDAALGNLLR